MMAFLVLAFVVPQMDCVAIQHEKVLGKDLASAVPALQALAADGEFGPAPLPGNKRVFERRELARIAAENQIAAVPDRDVCFAWATKQLARESIRNAMQLALGPRQVQIDVLDRSLWPAPEGEIVFPLSSLTLNANGIALWRGFVRYGTARRFDIWARARISVTETRVIATQKISGGRPVAAAQIGTETYEGALTRERPYACVQDVVGFIPKFDLLPGTVLTDRLLDAPHDVERGETLAVTAQIGLARVEAECVAEDSGRAGTIIPVHNARSGRRLRVLVEGKGKAVVASSDALGLLAEDSRR